MWRVRTKKTCASTCQETTSADDEIFQYPKASTCMTNEEGLQLKIGEMVWCIGVFENLWTPYTVVTIPYSKAYERCGSPREGDRDNVFVMLVPFEHSTDIKYHERMNVAHLSKTHPRGWIFTMPETNTKVLA